MMARRASTLFVATTTDAASINIARNMMSIYHWNELKADNDMRVLKTVALNKNIYLWIVNQSLLSLDYVDQLFARELQSVEIHDSVADVFFVSKHAAASGTVSLTVHPIGIPQLLEAGRYGGLPGKCSPPNHHIGSLYRSILKHVAKHEWDKTFQVTLEATHHGPYVEVPTCFVEIGSSEAEWSNENAGRIWARCLGQYFGMDPIPTVSDDPDTSKPSFGDHDEFVEGCEYYDEIENGTESGIVCMQIGGGHYVPKMNDMVSSTLIPFLNSIGILLVFFVYQARFSSKIFVGHALATYTLQEAFESGVVEEDGTPRWRKIIQEGINSTRIAFPVNSNIFRFVQVKLVYCLITCIHRQRS